MYFAEPSRIEQYFLLSQTQVIPDIDANLQCRDPWFSLGDGVLNMNHRIFEGYPFVVCDRSHRQYDSASQGGDNQLCRAYACGVFRIPPEYAKGILPDRDLSISLIETDGRYRIHKDLLPPRLLLML